MSKPGFNLKDVMGLGTEGIDKGVLGQPFLTITQKGSPEFDETHRKHEEKKIEGAKPGTIIFAPARCVLPQPVSIVPIAMHHHYTEWKPRSTGGGFVGNQPLSVISSRSYRKGQANTPDQYKEWNGDNELKYTIMASVVFNLKGTPTKGLISFTSTQLKPARLWSKQILNLRYPNMPDAIPPIFAASWNLTSSPDSNDKGGWYGWEINFDRLLDPVNDQVMLETSFKIHRSEGRTLPSLTAGSDVELHPMNQADNDVPF